MEQVVMEISATMEGAGGLGQGKLKVTTERLIFERKRAFGGAGDVASFPLSSIQSAGISGVLERKLKVRAGSTELVFKSSLMSNSDTQLKAINDLLQRSLAGYPLTTPVQAPGGIPGPPPTPSVVAGVGDVEAASAGWLDEIERLARLHAAGALNDDEFARAKRKILGGT